MITPQQHQKEINKIKRSYENILIDIMFSLVDIEEILETHSFPEEAIQKRIEEIKKRIGEELRD